MKRLLAASVKLAVPNVGEAPLITDWSNALTLAIEVNSESINAPAAVTLVASVTSADDSIPPNLVAIEELKAVNDPDIEVAVNAFTKASDVTSESIRAPAAVTLVVST